MEKIVGTAGHIDHGKTALVKALTGTDADRLPEEKRRGITVDLGFAEMTIGDVHFGFVDVPGHERFVKNMLAGASGIDLVILVIAANEGVMPQTREHFEICRLLGVKSGIVAITKSDLVDADTLELAKIEAAELVDGSFLESAPVVTVSSQSGDGLSEIRDALAEAASNLKGRQDRFVARLPIDRSFSMKGFGTVVTGTLASGEIAEGDEIELLPESRVVRVRGLQTHGKSVTKVHAGQRVAVNLAGIGHTEIERGMLLAEPGTLRPTQIIDVEIEVLRSSARPLRSRQRVRLHIGTAEVLARVQVLNEVGEISQGDRAFAQLTLEKPIVAIPGECFIVRSYSPQLTIAGGMVVENMPARHRRKDLAAANRFLGDLFAAAGDQAETVRLLTSASAYGVSFEALQIRTGFTKSVLNSAIGSIAASGSIVKTGEFCVSAKQFEALKQSATSALENFHEQQPLARGMPREELRDKTFVHLPAEVFQVLVISLASEGKIEVEKETIRLALYEKVLSPAETAVSETIRAIFNKAMLAVPKVDEAIAESIAGTSVSPQQARKLLQVFLDSTEIVKVSDEFYFDKVVIDDLATSLKQFATSTPDRSIDVSEFKDLAGVSRKYAIPLLEYFDRERVTMRAGDKRLIL